MATRRFVSKEITFNPGSYIGEYGELWVGDDDTTLRVGNNTTPGGVIVSGGGGDPIELTVTGYSEDIWAGATVHFVKENYGNQVDNIDTQVAITRGENQGIYNPITESSYDSDLSPEYTLWNIDGWQNLSNVTQRNYILWSDIIDNNPPGLIGSELVMFDTYNNKYHALKFLTWQYGGEGGAFSYVRREINTVAYFNKLDNEPNVDIVSTQVHIVRDNNNGAIYNDVTESDWDQDISPQGTLWNQDGWDNLTDVESRQYLTFYTCVGAGNIGKRVLGTKFVMKDVANNAYYTIMFTHWTPNGNGGGFSYIRQKIDLTNPQSGITFADGSNQTTAFTEQRLGIVPTTTIDYNYNKYLSTFDIGKSVTLTDTALVYVPDYADQPIPVGSVITIINLTGSSIEIRKDNDDENGTIYGAGTAETNTTWYLPDNGGGNIATLIKLSQTSNGSSTECNWMICGSGITT